MVRPHTDENQVTAPISHTVCRQAARPPLIDVINRPPARGAPDVAPGLARMALDRLYGRPAGAAPGRCAAHTRVGTVSRRAQLPPAHLYVEHACLTPDELKNPTRFEFRYQYDGVGV